jgi:hypothetical protein
MNLVRFAAAAWAVAVVSPFGAGTASAIVLGDTRAGQPYAADTQANRIDPNAPAGRPFGGVGSIYAESPPLDGFGSLGTGTVLLGRDAQGNLTRRHVLTAAHVVDTQGGFRPGSSASDTGDGTVDAILGGNSVFVLNNGSNQSSVIGIASVSVAPNWHGFNNRNGPEGASINDDLAILTLSQDVPLNTPVYDIFRGTMGLGTTLNLVGYGTTGDGINGFTANSAGLFVKRSGKNNADAFHADDEGAAGRLERFEFDFDNPAGGNGEYGGPSLGNLIETTIGAGDSGGPAFIGGSGPLDPLVVAGVNTYGAQYRMNSPVQGLFGSGGGGMLVSSYASWIDGITGAAVPEPATVGVLALASSLLLARRRTV